MEEFYGVRNMKNYANDPVVLCTNCMKKYYEDISDERN